MPRRKKYKESFEGDEESFEGVDEEKFVLLIVQHVDLKSKIDTLTEERSALTDTIKKQIVSLGEVDDKGSVIYSRFMGKRMVTAKNTARISSDLVPEAAEILSASKEGKKYVKTQTIQVVNTDLLQMDILSGKVDAGLVKRLYAIKKTYALTTSVK